MQRSFQFTLTGLTATAVFLACEESTSLHSGPAVAGPSFTMASGFTTTPVARGNAGALHVNSKANGYGVQIKARDNTDIAVADIVVVPGGTSGWHSHPGPVLVVVKTGAITFYSVRAHGDDENENGHHRDDPDCSRTVHPAGTAFIEAGGHVVLAKNEGSTDATVTATYFVPAGAATRIDQPAPGGNCPS